jgi:hypothetical protein
MIFPRVLLDGCAEIQQRGDAKEQVERPGFRVVSLQLPPGSYPEHHPEHEGAEQDPIVLAIATKDETPGFNHENNTADIDNALLYGTVHIGYILQSIN